MYKCKYCNREFERRHQLIGHISWCKENPKYDENKKKKQLDDARSKKKLNSINKTHKDNTEYVCKFCGKVCLGKISLSQHECRCKENPNRKESTFIRFNKKRNKVWNKGLTKETDSRVKQQGQTFSQRVKTGIITSVGGFRESAVKGCYKYGYYKNIRCDSSWELAFVVFNIEHNIPIKRNTQRFEYFIDGKKHIFIPDFVVNETEIIEIKGKQDSNWKRKQLAYPNIKFIFREDIKKYLDYVITKYGKEFWKKLYN